MVDLPDVIHNEQNMYNIINKITGESGQLNNMKAISEKGNDNKRVRLLNSGRVCQAAYWGMVSVMPILGLVFAVSDFEIFESIDLNTSIMMWAKEYFGHSVIFMVFPLAIFYLTFLFLSISSVNDDYMGVVTIYMLADTLVSVALYFRTEQLYDAMIVLLIKVTLLIIAVIMNWDYRNSIKARKCYKIVDNHGLLESIDWLNKRLPHKKYFRWSELIMAGIAVYFDWGWLWVIGLIYIVFIEVLDLPKSISSDVRKVVLSLNKEITTYCYDEDYAASNGINYSQMLRKLLAICLIPVILLLAITVLVYSGKMNSLATDIVLLLAFISYIIYGFYRYNREFYAVKMKNTYYQKNVSGLIFQYTIDDSNDSENKLSGIKIESEDEVSWHCSYRADGKDKHIRIAKAYPGLLKAIEQKQQFTTDDAVNRLLEAKSEKDEDFNAAASEADLSKMKGNSYSQVIPFYSVSDGFRANYEYRFLSYQESVETTDNLSKIIKNEFKENMGEWIAIAECANGDKVVVNSSGRTVRIDHEKLNLVVTEWESLADFICFVFDNR
ncbi:MAG: hypothetical protein K6A14_03900 [Erysipelotrichaceae bacterium]|nr:hypothetical protein [Erysipelotrichaceae bacterium]